jgi:hypothetical protein
LAHRSWKVLLALVPALAGCHQCDPNPRATASEVAALKNYLLRRINDERRALDLSEVRLGDNVAASRHAESMFSNKFGGHWGLDGLKPYMRYTLAGGTGEESENVRGVSPSDSGVCYEQTRYVDQIEIAHSAFMESPGHRATVLDPRNEIANLGIFCDLVQCAVDEQFEHSWLTFVDKPVITNGILKFGANARPDFVLRYVRVTYDPPPRAVSGQQIDRTYCYDEGAPVLIIYAGDRSPQTTLWTWHHCLGPDEPQQNVNDGNDNITIGSDLPVLGSTVAKDSETAFHLQADINDVLAAHPQGIYTVRITGDTPAGFGDAAAYSIWVGLERPR